MSRSVTETPYNPLDLVHLSESVVRALLDREPTRLDQIEAFLGAGIYALYYTGPHVAYARLTQAHQVRPFSTPIYVGRAVPVGARVGADVGASARSRALFGRLADHANSIRAAGDLSIEDFYARWLPVESLWIALGESMLIQNFRPVWNVVLDGFGNHDPGGGRRAGAVSKWDALHRGRRWAELLTGERPTSQAVQELVRNQLDSFFSDADEVIADPDYDGLQDRYHRE